MSRDSFERIGIPIVFIAVILFLGITLLINTSKSCDTYMEFIVLGADNATPIEDYNISSIKVIEMRYNCLNICNAQFKSSDGSKLRGCWEQCHLLGEAKDD